LRDKEEREKEGQIIIKSIKELEKEEAQNALKKKSQQKQLLDEIYNSNNNAVLVKQKRI
jgi:hypothetical protein